MTTNERREILKRARADAETVAALGRGEFDKAEAAGAALRRLDEIGRDLRGMGYCLRWRGGRLCISKA